MRLSPFCPSDAVYHLAYTLSWLGEHGSAIQAVEEYGRRVPTDVYGYTLQSIVFDFAGDQERSTSAIGALRKLYPAFTLKDFIEHEFYRDPNDLGRVVDSLRQAGLSE